eukprot:10327987-Karenia_brevis.AAC.1
MRNAPCKNPWSSDKKPMKSRGEVGPSARLNDSNRFDENASFNWPEQVPKSMPRMPRRITNCNGCG